MTEKSNRKKNVDWAGHVSVRTADVVGSYADTWKVPYRTHVSLYDDTWQVHTGDVAAPGDDTW